MFRLLIIAIHHKFAFLHLEPVHYVRAFEPLNQRYMYQYMWTLDLATHALC